jgi:hypothetical protein
MVQREKTQVEQLSDAQMFFDGASIKMSKSLKHHLYLVEHLTYKLGLDEDEIFAEVAILFFEEREEFDTLKVEFELWTDDALRNHLREYNSTQLRALLDDFIPGIDWGDVFSEERRIKAFLLVAIRHETEDNATHYIKSLEVVIDREVESQLIEAKQGEGNRKYLDWIRGDIRICMYRAMELLDAVELEPAEL